MLDQSPESQITLPVGIRSASWSPHLHVRAHSKVFQQILEALARILFLSFWRSFHSFFLVVLLKLEVAKIWFYFLQNKSTKFVKQRKVNDKAWLANKCQPYNQFLIISTGFLIIKHWKVEEYQYVDVLGHCPWTQILSPQSQDEEGQFWL